jgi:hypothetical protein
MTVPWAFLIISWIRYGKNRPPQKASFFRAIHFAFGRYFYLTGLLKIINDVMVLMGPFLLDRIVTFLKEDNDEPMWHGYLYASGAIHTDFLPIPYKDFF